VRDVSARLANKERRRGEPESRVCESQQERRRAQTSRLRDRSGRESGHCDGAVPRGFVEAHRKAARPGPGEIDLHDHGRRPRQPLVQPQEDVRDDDPAPCRRPDEQQRYGQPNEPARHENRLATKAIGHRAGNQIRAGLRDSEGDEKGENGADTGDTEDVRGQNRQEGSLLADHPADERIDANQQRELAKVRAQPELNAPLSDARRRSQCHGSPDAHNTEAT
jgi:hypothetical protein